MKKIEIPNQLLETHTVVNKEQIEAYFENSGKAPSIKEQMILKAYEITEETKLLFDSKEVSLLFNCDSTGTYLSCFNKLEEDITVNLPLVSMGLNKKYMAYCVLTGEELGIIEEALELQIPDRGILLVKILEK